MVSDSDEASLQRNRTDTTAAVVRAVAGGIPFLGSAIQEVLTAVIPNQRIDRIVDCLRRLEEMLDELQRDTVQARIKDDPEACDLFEEAMGQATRAVSDTRREHIAALLKNSLTQDDLDYIAKSKLWQLFHSLNDVEILVLQSFGVQQTPDEDAFWEQHQDVVTGPRAHLGSSQDEVDRAAIFSTYRKHLADLGLLQPNFKRPRRGEFPEFDEKTGMMKASGYKLTSVGRLLLRQLGLPTRF